MAGLNDFSATVRKTPVIERMLESMVIEASQALRDICKTFQATGEPMGGHHLPAGGYMGEMIVRMLIDAKLIEEVEGQERGYLHRYKPTKDGEKIYAALDKEGAYKRRVVS